MRLVGKRPTWESQILPRYIATLIPKTIRHDYGRLRLKKRQHRMVQFAKPNSCGSACSNGRADSRTSQVARIAELYRPGASSPRGRSIRCLNSQASEDRRDVAGKVAGAHVLLEVPPLAPVAVVSESRSPAAFSIRSVPASLAQHESPCQAPCTERQPRGWLGSVNSSNALRRSASTTARAVGWFSASRAYAAGPSTYHKRPVRAAAARFRRQFMRRVTPHRGVCRKAPPKSP